MEHYDAFAEIINYLSIDDIKNLRLTDKLCAHYGFNYLINNFYINADIIDVIYLPTIKKIIINEKINDVVMKSKTLTHITFGDNFNKEISVLSGLTLLTHLTFGHYFNKKISALSGLTSLTHLTFGYNFNGEISALSGLSLLTHLTFGDWFNQKISAL